MRGVDAEGGLRIGRRHEPRTQGVTLVAGRLQASWVWGAPGNLLEGTEAALCSAEDTTKTAPSCRNQAVAIGRN